MRRLLPALLLRNAQITLAAVVCCLVPLLVFERISGGTGPRFPLLLLVGVGILVNLPALALMARWARPLRKLERGAGEQAEHAGSQAGAQATDTSTSGLAGHAEALVRPGEPSDPDGRRRAAPPPSQLADGVAILRLPRRFAGAHLAAWFATGGLTGAIVLFQDRFRPDRAFLLFLACMLVGIGAALVAFVRTTRGLSPVWKALPRPDPGEWAPQGRVTSSLKQKITLVLGGVVFFSSAFGLYSSFALQREIVSYYVRQKGQEMVRAMDSCAPLRPGTAAWAEAVGKIAPDRGALLVWAESEPRTLGVPLPPGQVEQLARAAPGLLSVPSLNLEGMKHAADWGSFVALFPQPEWAQSVLLVSLVFYTLLFLFSGYLAAQVAGDLTTPLMELRHQVRRIERGDLEERIASTSSDEIGELAGAVESMRRGLKQMVETIRSMNVTLEEKVRQRTAELSQANEDLTRTLEELKVAETRLVHSEKMASLGRLMSGLAHELNNPINAIANSAGPLKDGLDDLTGRSDDPRVARLSRAAGVLVHAASRTVELLGSLATFSRHDEQARKPADLNAAVAATLMLLQHRTEAIGTAVEVLPGELPSVPCNPGEINQVLMNLLVNALEAVQHLGKEGRVSVRTCADDTSVEVAIRDNGPGMEAAAVSRIFEPFYTTKASGVGLGLAISHDIIERHGGSIDVETAPGQGSLFRLRLPRV
jgi:signal transduction histidine kinase